MSKEKQTYNPCDDCQYSFSKNGQESGMCKICEFTYFKDRKQSEWISVEVVRCKDCEYWNPMDNGISWHNKGRTDGECDMLYRVHCAERHITEQDHFCSYAKMKGGE